MPDEAGQLTDGEQERKGRKSVLADKKGKDEENKDKKGRSSLRRGSGSPKPGAGAGSSSPKRQSTGDASPAAGKRVSLKDGKRGSIGRGSIARGSIRSRSLPPEDRPERPLALELSSVDESTFEALKETLNTTRGLNRWLGSRAPDGTVSFYFRTKARQDVSILNPIFDCLDFQGCNAVITSLEETENVRKGIERWSLENSGRI